jgi:hypothetical protein
MGNERTPRYQPTFIPNDIEKTIRIPWPVNSSDQNSFGNHLNNIQWMAQGSRTEWLFRFDPEEYNCVVRYLSNPKFNWVRG